MPYSTSQKLLAVSLNGLKVYCSAFQEPCMGAEQVNCAQIFVTRKLITGGLPHIGVTFKNRGDSHHHFLASVISV